MIIRFFCSVRFFLLVNSWLVKTCHRQIEMTLKQQEATNVSVFISDSLNYLLQIFVINNLLIWKIRDYEFIIKSFDSKTDLVMNKTALQRCFETFRCSASGFTGKKKKKKKKTRQYCI